MVIISEGEKLTVALLGKDFKFGSFEMANEPGKHAIRHAVRMLQEAFDFAVDEENSGKETAEDKHGKETAEQIQQPGLGASEKVGD